MKMKYREQNTIASLFKKYTNPIIRANLLRLLGSSDRVTKKVTKEITTLLSIDTKSTQYNGVRVRCDILGTGIFEGYRRAITKKKIPGIPIGTAFRLGLQTSLYNITERMLISQSPQEILDLLEIIQECKIGDYEKEEFNQFLFAAMDAKHRYRELTPEIIRTMIVFGEEAVNHLVYTIQEYDEDRIDALIRIGNNRSVALAAELFISSNSTMSIERISNTVIDTENIDMFTGILLSFLTGAIDQDNSHSISSSVEYINTICDTLIDRADPEVHLIIELLYGYFTALFNDSILPFESTRDIMNKIEVLKTTRVNEDMAMDLFIALYPLDATIAVPVLYRMERISEYYTLDTLFNVAIVDEEHVRNQVMNAVLTLPVREGAIRELISSKLKVISEERSLTDEDIENATYWLGRISHSPNTYRDDDQLEEGDIIIEL